MIGCSDRQIVKLSNFQKRYQMGWWRVLYPCDDGLFTGYGLGTTET